MTVAINTHVLYFIMWKKNVKVIILSNNCLTLEAPALQNGETHSDNSSATADELFEYV